MDCIKNDSGIRAAIHSQLIQRHHANPATVVLDELGLCHGRARIDIAVINGHFHGYEIKADADDLSRLAAQLRIYNSVLDRGTVVVTSKHLGNTTRMLPAWWGITVPSLGRQGKICFSIERRATLNPGIDPLMVSALLWRNEVVTLLEALGHDKKSLRRPRHLLYQELCETLTLEQIRSVVRKTLKSRQTWRDRPQPS